MERIPILQMGPFLLVTIQVDMHDRLAMTLQDDLTNKIEQTGASGVSLQCRTWWQGPQSPRMRERRKWRKGWRSRNWPLWELSRFAARQRDGRRLQWRSRRSDPPAIAWLKQERSRGS